ncbi:MAG: (Fe-S)-binding protein [Chloroflexota bacterium]
MAPDVVSELNAAAERCNQCGFCQAACPTYKTTGIEWTVARGRLALLRDALNGRLPLDDSIREPLFNCLTCGACTEHCFPAVPTADIVTRARAELVRRQGEPWVQQLLFRQVLPNPGLLGLGVKAVWLSQITGVEPFAQASGALKLLGKLGEAAGVLPRLPGQNGRAKASAALRPLSARRARVAYFLGCGTNNVFPNAAAAAVRVLQRQNVEVVLPEVVCCGKPPLAYGDETAARELARRNVDALLGLDVDAVVTDCATCGSFLHEYGDLLAEDPAYAERARALSAKVQDVLQFLAALGIDPNLGRLQAKVTYHDPCHLGRFQKVGKQPRELLKAIPGLDYRELPEANMCCGGAGSYSLTHYDISMMVLDRKMENVARTGAQVLATACPGCAMQLSHGVKRQNLPVQVKHVVELLDRAYEVAE